RSAAEKGLLKILSKMGISTLQSYAGAQIFEAIGLGSEVMDRCFTGTASVIGGIGFKEIAEDVLARHQRAGARTGGAARPARFSRASGRAARGSRARRRHPAPIHLQCDVARRVVAG